MPSSTRPIIFAVPVSTIAASGLTRGAARSALNDLLAAQRRNVVAAVAEPRQNVFAVLAQPRGRPIDQRGRARQLHGLIDDGGLFAGGVRHRHGHADMLYLG